MSEEKYWLNLERTYVHNVYESISSQYEIFSSATHQYVTTSRERDDKDLVPKAVSQIAQQHHIAGTKRMKHGAWPKVRKFLLQLDSHSLVADIGCGDGKYLNINNRIFTIGCDYSSSLCQMASSKSSVSPLPSVSNKNQILICDNLSLPFRSNLFDAVISIGVIHHLSTKQRRMRALQQLCRILKLNGKIMIYVWAMEQRARKFNCQDILVPMLNTNTTILPKVDIKFQLRRDLSNNSTAGNSEDSNDESGSATSLDKYFNSDMTKKSIIVSSNDRKQVPQIATVENTTTSLNLHTKFYLDTCNQGNLESENSSSVNSHEHVSSEKPEENSLFSENNGSFIKNLKNYFTKKFSPASLSCSPATSISVTHKETSLNLVSEPIVSSKDTEKEVFTERLNEKINRTPRSKTSHLSRLDKQLSWPQNIEKMYLTKRCGTKRSESNTNYNEKKPLSDVSSIENYKQILEKHKDLLPKGFVLREFPFSSCEKTFTSSNSANKANFSIYEKKLNPMKDAQHASSIPASDICHQAQLASNNSPQVNEDLSGNNNNLNNKRYYHVFTKGELNELFKESCPNMSIYDSYYDHGNWCICATKTSLLDE